MYVGRSTYALLLQSCCVSVLDLTVAQFLQVDVTCTGDKSGKSCNAIGTPEAACGDGIDTLMFTYIGGNCEQSVNSQDGFNCQDTYGGPSEGDDAQIDCTDEGGAEAYSGTVAVGDQISFGDKKDLPDVIYCAVKDRKGSLLQEFNIRTTDYDDLYLKDIFGSLQLESCDDHECLIDITYVYTIKNDGSTSLEITSVDRSREGTTDDVTGLVKDGNLNAGDTTPAQEPSVLDICVSGSIVTIVEATGKPPSGSPVSSDGSLVLETHGLPKREIPEPCVGGKGSGK